MAKVDLSAEDARVFYGMAAQDLMSFCVATDKNYDPQFFHRVIAEALMKIETGEIKRLLIELPPRSGKSQLTTINFLAWYLGRHPDKNIITASYNSDLASKFGGQTRDLMNEPAYKMIFPQSGLKEDTTAKNYWRTKQGGGYLAVGVGGTATGFGADIIAIDDPVKSSEEADSEVYREKVWDWYTHVARTRLEKDGAIILCMTRWHSDDLAGRILDREVTGGERWHRVTFKAVAEENDRYRDVGDVLWPKKYSKEDLVNTRHEIGERAFYSLYQQTPIAGENQIFRPEWMKKEFEPASLEGKTLNRYITIDVANTEKDGADYTGVLVVDIDADNNWYIVLAKRYRVNIRGLVDLVFNLWNEHKPQKIGVEKNSFADQLKPLLDEQMDERQCWPVVVELEHKGRRKEARIIGALQGRFEKGKIYFRKGAHDDTDALKRELFDFPRGKHDDEIDALAYIDQIGQRPFSQKKEEKTSISSEIEAESQRRGRAKVSIVSRI